MLQLPGNVDSRLQHQGLPELPACWAPCRFQTGLTIARASSLKRISLLPLSLPPSLSSVHRRPWKTPHPSVHLLFHPPVHLLLAVSLENPGWSTCFQAPAL